jgi:hypothetical protein
MTSIKLLNPQTQEHKEVPVGFSVTCMFFGPFVPLLRGNWKWAIMSILYLGLGVALMINFVKNPLFPLLMIPFNIFWFLFQCYYNRFYVEDLMEKGFQMKEIVY